MVLLEELTNDATPKEKTVLSKNKNRFVHECANKSLRWV